MKNNQTLHRKHSYFSRLYAESFIILCIAIITYFVAEAYIKTYPRIPEFEQNGFGPAVMKVCGKGYIGTFHVNSPALNLFFNPQGDLNASFNCSSLPTDIKPSPLNELATHSIYLFNTVAFFWKLNGISYKALFPLLSITFSITMSLAYSLFRLGLNRFFALAGVLILIILGFYLEYLSHFRDFSVVPFVFAILLCIGFLVRKKIAWQFLVSLSALGGIITGISLGFRDDSMLYIILFLFTLLFFIKLTEKSVWKWKSIAVITYFTGFLITGLPILKAYSNEGGNNLFHNVLQGFSNFFIEPLHIKRSPIYSVLEGYSDNLIYERIQSHEEQTRHIAHIIAYGEKEYGHVTRDYLLLLIKNFPADFVIRTYASILQILRFPYENYLNWFTQNVKYFNSDFFISYFPIFSAITVLGILTFYSARVAFFTGSLLLFLTAYPVIQFSLRHYFYLCILSIWLLLFLFQACYSGLRYVNEDLAYLAAIRHNNFLKKIFKFLVSVFLLFLALTALLYFLRLYQQKNLTNVFSHYEKATLKPIVFDKVLSSDGNIVKLTLHSWLYHNPAFPLRSSDYNYAIAITGHLKYPVRYSLVMLDFETARCGNHHLVLNFDKINSVGLEVKKSLKIFHPFIYELNTTPPNIEMTQETYHCLKGIYQVEPDSVPPLWLTLKLSNDWKSKPLYLRFGSDSFPERTQTLFTFPLDLSLKKLGKEFSPDPSTIEWTDIVTRMVSQQKDKIIISGKSPYPYGYLVKFSPKNITASSYAHNDYYFVAEGEIQSGGLAVGLIKDQSWDPTIDIPGKGQFKVIIKPNHPGQYQPVIANYVLVGMKSKAVINKVGWIVLPKLQPENQ